MQHWTILPDLAVRTTGFPIETLQRLRFNRTALLVAEVLETERRVAALRHELLRQHLPLAVSQAARSAESRPLLKLLSVWRRQVTRRCAVTRPPDSLSFEAYPGLHNAIETWHSLIETLASRRASAHQAWLDELATARLTLWELAADPRVLEAIFLSNPDMYRAVSTALTGGGGSRRVSAVRRLERSLMSYLQRLCAKNETASFFGPINYGRLDPTEPLNIRIKRSPLPLRRRRSFASQWMVEALAAAISADRELQPFLEPRRGTRWRLSRPDGIEDTASGRRLPLDPTSVRLVELCDGSRTVRALAAAVGLDHLTCWERLERLARSEVVVTRLLVPGDHHDPLDYLLDWLTRLPAEVPAGGAWRRQVELLQREVASLAADDLPERVARLARIEERFESVCGRPAQRGAGAMYADRGLVFEECLGDLEVCVLGGTLQRAISQRLQPIFRLWQAAARLRAERDKRAARAVWRAASQSPCATGVPLLRFLAVGRSIGQSGPEAEYATPDGLDALLSSLGNLVGEHSDGHRARLSSADLPELRLPPERDACAYTSIDLLIDAPSQAALQAGEFRVIVGEAHAPPLTWVFPTAHFLDQRLDVVGDALHAGLTGQPGGTVAAQLALARDTKIFPLLLPGPTIELRPHAADCRAIPASSVEVRAQDDELYLCAGGQRLRLYAPLKRRGVADPFAALAFPGIEMLPIDLGRHTPRIEIDDIVYQRERWVLRGGALGEPGARDFELFLDTWRWKERNGVPDEIFVRFPGEPKPIYVDLRNHFLVELFDHLARQCSQMTVSEMLPSSSGTWLEGPGGRFSAEYRAVAVADVDGGIG